MKKRLYDMEYGEEGIVKSIDPAIMSHVAGMGVRVGKKIKMLTKQPIKGPVVISINRSEISLGKGIAEMIVVEV
ncbi:MAG TPA: ferrous iron transport protein A [Thermoplasmatales archaeon]|nr:ferrous iron transport protein A [Thermoplasmatales archaeon]